VDQVCAKLAAGAGHEESFRLSRRLEARLGRPFALERAVGELEAGYDSLGGDFAEFSPTLREHIEGLR
jgi:hypothetical protein